ncbi:MAG: glycoside hydrolase family 88/105 protein [Chitinophagaceae bacterium]
MKLPLLIAAVSFTANGFAQVKMNDVNTPLHAMKPDYITPYGAPNQDSVKTLLNRVYTYLNQVTPAEWINKHTKAPVATNAIDTQTIFKPGDFRLTSYEWGVTYSGMLRAGETTGDARYTDYVKQRLRFLADGMPAFKRLYQQYPKQPNAMRSVIDPHALDDAGALCAAIAKLIAKGDQPNLRPLADNFIQYISSKEFRLPDGTLARNRPQPNTLWLDDLYMSIPALAQMGKLTGNNQYFDDAVAQIELFGKRMFVAEKKLFMHGWVEEMQVHPTFHWARANGWAIMAMAELLEVLPESHPGRKKVLQLFRIHAEGILAMQDGTGFWHQLLDRNDSYLETSATAIYAYCFARGINKGWLDEKAFAPAALLAWNAVSTKVNGMGQVEGTCVGTGMAFDAAFYYYRPVNVFAAHGYGPVLLAGAEVIELLKKHKFEINDSSLQLVE